MFLLGASSSAVGYDSVLHHSLMFLIKTLLVSMIYMMFSLLVNIIHMILFLFIWNKQYVDVIMIMFMMFLFFSNKHLITTVMIMIMSFCWIKLNLKLPIFITATSLCSRSKAQKYPHHALPAWFLCEQNLIWMRRLIAEALHVQTRRPFALKQRQHSM
jgi:hypothetical protein